MNISIVRLLRTRKILCTEINQTYVTLLYILAVLSAILDIHIAFLILREVESNHTIRERREERKQIADRQNYIFLEAAIYDTERCRYNEFRISGSGYEEELTILLTLGKENVAECYYG
jgi:hypothetical protein